MVIFCGQKNVFPQCQWWFWFKTNALAFARAISIIMRLIWKNLGLLWCSFEMNYFFLQSFFSVPILKLKAHALLVLRHIWVHDGCYNFTSFFSFLHDQHLESTADPAHVISTPPTTTAHHPTSQPPYVYSFRCMNSQVYTVVSHVLNITN